MEQPEGNYLKIPLDGTYGAGPDSEVVIVTATGDGRQKETSYTIPYYCLNLVALMKMCDLNLILGYRVVKSEARAAGLKELGL